MTADAEAAGRLPDPAVTLVEADPPGIRNLDRTASGRERLQDLEFLHASAHARGFIALDATEVIGYGYCRLSEVPEQGSPGAFLGPIGAASGADATRTATAILRWAGEHASRITIPVFGPHPATPIILAARFRIQDIDTYMASRVDLIDLAHYFPSMELGRVMNAGRRAASHSLR